MEEIKAGDIMIGNWVMFENTTHVVTEISETLIATRWIKSKDKYIHTLSDLRPIPLTEDILLKAGFRKHKMSGYDTHFIYSLFIGGETIGITAIYNADFSIMLHGVARGVKYLHRLQNIIKFITGNELKINL